MADLSESGAARDGRWDSGVQASGRNPFRQERMAVWAAGCPAALGCGEGEEGGDAVSGTVALEVRHEVLDELFAARGADAAGEGECFSGCVGGEFGFFELEVAGGLVRQEDAAGFGSGVGQEVLALGDELVDAAGKLARQPGFMAVRLTKRHPET
ncbi:hypothetical protein Slala04_02290 [Streptomyces lavendulae subsp. lavendulae]|nr:hypothetical protein Slala04_02290 [Streptomyces lavendulae subsp. lavendulae]